MKIFKWKSFNFDGNLYTGHIRGQKDFEDWLIKNYSIEDIMNSRMNMDTIDREVPTFGLNSDFKGMCLVIFLTT